MRLAFTIGITNDDKAVVLKDHTSLLRDHKSALNGDEYKGEYKDVFILETSSATQKKRFSIGSGRVNHGAALPVARQNKKAMAAASDEMKPKGKQEGKVNFEKASLTVAEQTGRAPVRRRSRKGKAKKTSAQKTASPARTATPPPLPKEDEKSADGPSL